VARFYLDHDVSLRLALLLRAAGHDTTTAQEAGLSHASDDAQLLAAAQQQRILVTHNRKDYVLLHDAWRRWPVAWGTLAPPHAGILVLDHRPERELAAAVETFIAAVHHDPANLLCWWRPHDGLRYQLADRRWVSYP
jgi:Domain of unknown function (DUF5615)